MKTIKFTFVLILLATSICWTGCEVFVRHSSPLAGWNSSSLVNFQNNKVISDDCHAYISNLPTKLRNGVGPLEYFEDGKGQHAVLIAIAQNGTDWAHVLIYDKDNKRIKIIKYISGHYRS